MIALGEILDDWDARHRRSARKTFWGYRCRFVRAVDEVMKEPACLITLNDSRLASTEALLAMTAEYATRESQFETVLRRLRALAELRLSTTEDPMQPREGLFDESTDQEYKLSNNTIQPTPSEMASYRDTLKILSHQIQEWNLAQWRYLSFVHDCLNYLRGNSNAVIERTPIVVASGNVGRVLRLVGERLDGPPIATPHWWNLGVVPLGGLYEEIQKAISEQLCYRKFRFQVRWWLEKKRNPDDWPVEIETGQSVRAAAACLTLALAESSAEESVLDDMTAISAQCNDGIKLGSVGNLSRKAAALWEDGIRFMILWPDDALLLSKQIEDKVISPDLIPELIPCTTLDVAYEELRRASKQLQKTKQLYTDNLWDSEFQQSATDERFK